MIQHINQTNNISFNFKWAKVLSNVEWPAGSRCLGCGVIQNKDSSVCTNPDQFWQNSNCGSDPPIRGGRKAPAAQQHPAGEEEERLGSVWLSPFALSGSQRHISFRRSAGMTTPYGDLSICRCLIYTSKVLVELVALNFSSLWQRCNNTLLQLELRFPNRCTSRFLIWSIRRGPPEPQLTLQQSISERISILPLLYHIWGSGVFSPSRALDGQDIDYCVHFSLLISE